MKTIKISESDLMDMKQFYQDELDKTLKRLQHIRNVMELLGNKNRLAKGIELSETMGGDDKVSTKESVKKTERKAKKKKPGRKSIWEELIVKQLELSNKPITYDKLTEEIMKFGNIPDAKKEATKRAITNLIFRLKKQNRLLKVYSTGSREKFIALSSWFDKSGEIMEQYKVALPAKPVKQVRKRKEVKKKAEPVKTQTKEKAKKEVEKPTWVAYVLDMLKIENKPLQVRTMAMRAMSRFNLDKKMYGKTRLAVARSMTHLEKNSKLVKRHEIEGKRPGYYGLTEWFDDNNQLKKEYQAKLT